MMKLKCLSCGNATTSVYATRRCDCGELQVPISGRMKQAAKSLYEIGLPIKHADEFIVYDNINKEHYYHSMIYIDFRKVVDASLFFDFDDYRLGHEWDMVEFDEMGLFYSRLLCSYSRSADTESDDIVRQCKDKNKAMAQELTQWGQRVNASGVSQIFFLAGLI